MPCPGPFHFSHSVDYIYEFCPLPDPDVGPSISNCGNIINFAVFLHLRNSFHGNRNHRTHIKANTMCKAVITNSYIIKN